MIIKQDDHLKLGQSTLETAVLIVVIVMALITMQVYMKRGIQGHLQSSADSLGEQYDPKGNAEFTFKHQSYTTTVTNSSPQPVSAVGAGGWLVQQEKLITTSVIQTHYDNNYKNGYETMGDSL